MIKTLLADNLNALQCESGVSEALEQGMVVHLPHLHFAFSAAEQVLLSPHIVPSKAKNISYDPRTQHLKAFVPDNPHRVVLQNMMQRYADFAKELLQTLCPNYTAALDRARTSYRPVEIDGRAAASYRKDDRRLHVDAFPASPNQGRQLLRVFSNVHPHHVPRVWRVGEDFEQVVQHFKRQLRLPFKVTKYVLRSLHITRGLRTDYDALMLQLHDAMKADEAYQHNVTQQRLELTGTWLVYTDQVSHAAMSGQYCLEQTFMLPISARCNPETAPLRVLERAMGTALL